MKIAVDNRRAFPVVAIKGKMMGGPDTGVLDVKFYGLLALGVKKAVVDLKECEWINDSGLSILVHHCNKFKDAGGELVIASLSDKIERIMVIARLTEVFRVFEDRDAALIGLNKEAC